jgi:hypothetical protein
MNINPTSSLDLQVKLLVEYISYIGGYDKLPPDVLEEINKIKVYMPLGNVNPDTVGPTVIEYMSVMFRTQFQHPKYSPDQICTYQSTLQKSRCFVQENIDTVEQFDQIYEAFKDRTNFLYRGQREAKWRMYSTIQRHWITGGLMNRGFEHRALLENMVEVCRNKYRDQYQATLEEQHIDTDNDIAVLGFLQHHGCPTPLLDWTYKFQHALYFGIDGLDYSTRYTEIDDYFSVYLVDEKVFNESDMRKVMFPVLQQDNENVMKKIIRSIIEDEKERMKWESQFKGKDFIGLNRITGSGVISDMLRINCMLKVPAAYFDDRNPHFIRFSINNSLNIRNQAGVFIWNADPAKPFEMVVNEQNNKVHNDEGEIEYLLCECFNIHKRLKDHIKHRLDSDGIDAKLIYPVPELNTWNIYQELVK